MTSPPRRPASWRVRAASLLGSGPAGRGRAARPVRPEPLPRGALPAARPGRGSDSGHSSRLRLIVIQALVFSLFATLLTRLYFMQVVSGDHYRGQAAAQSVREVVQQPVRGLIVDDQGRPLVADRLSWVVSLDTAMLSRMSSRERARLVQRVGDVVGESPARIEQHLTTCGTAGAVAGRCWNGSPYQPVPVAEDVRQPVALQLMEQPEDYPGVVVDHQSVRSYPRPFGVNAAQVLGYLSPITESELQSAQRRDDRSVNAASVVGRSGLEQTYDRWLRGMPGYRRVAVDSMGRVLGDDSTVPSRPGDTLVTSLDAKVQASAERALHDAITTARATTDPVTGTPYKADSGAAIVLQAQTGRIVAMASQPTYDPSVWTGGISTSQLHHLYSAKAGTPLLARAWQGQFAPGSTWKPFMTAGAFANGYGPDSRLDCSSAFTVGNRSFKNYESESYGSISFAKALEVSCDTVFYRVGYHFWQEYGSDEADVHAKDPLVEEAQEFDFGKPTGVDLPGEASGRIADRRWKLAYYKAMKPYYCRIAHAPQQAGTSDFVYQFAQEFCVDGYAYRAGDAANFAIGQGDTLVTPLQLARGYAALANGGTLYAPRVGRAIVAPDGRIVKRIAPQVVGHVDVSKGTQAYIDQALQGVTTQGTMAWKMQGFPESKVTVRSKTGSAEVYGKQSTSWVASYDKDYVVLMMVSQGGTGSGTSGPGVRRIWESLYGIKGEAVHPTHADIPGTTLPVGLPSFQHDGAILPPVTEPAPTGTGRHPRRKARR